jgi:hypothetical protein
LDLAGLQNPHSALGFHSGPAEIPVTNPVQLASMMLVL